MHFLDEQSGKFIEHYQQVLFDNLPLYCTCCKYQGHEDADCQLMIKKNKREEGYEDDIAQQGEETNAVEQLQVMHKTSRMQNKLEIKSLMIRIMQVM